jgi:hypothetical protein
MKISIITKDPTKLGPKRSQLNPIFIYGGDGTVGKMYFSWKDGNDSEFYVSKYHLNGKDFLETCKEITKNWGGTHVFDLESEKLIEC